ncbi:MAG: type II secretion system F family protein [Armatimonadetes bacterium]|nr:type II secretion system F family protein [Armatimonadota bacterium]
MPTFKYAARDASGKSVTGVMDVESETELRKALRMNDLFLVKSSNHLKGATQSVSSAGRGGHSPSIFDRKPSLQDLVIAMRQLGTTVRAGLPLVQALELVGSQTNKPALASAFVDLERAVSEGNMLSTGMRSHPKLFTPLMVSLVEAGELAGTLDQTLEIAAMQLEREADLRRKVRAATVYPKLVVAACIGTIAVMLTVVVPVFAEVYQSLHAQLPTATTTLIKVSEVFVHYWWAAVLIVGVLSYGFKRYRTTENGKIVVDVALMKIPVLGVVLRKISIARFVQTLAGALKGGVPVLQSLTIAGSTAGNAVIERAVNDSAKNVRDGSTISEELQKSGEFPLMVTRLVAAGEATGNLDTMLEEINKFYEQDVEYAVNNFTRMIEPVMTILVGGIVLVVLLALYMPIFSLGKAVQNSALK